MSNKDNAIAHINDAKTYLEDAANAYAAGEFDVWVITDGRHSDILEELEAAIDEIQSIEESEE